MFYAKEKSISVLIIFLFIALFLSIPQLVYSQINIDTNVPKITQVSPEDGQTNVPVDTSITVLFSEFMDPILTNNSFWIDPYIEGQIFWELDQTLIFSPSMLLDYNEIYQVSIDTQATDLSGQSLQDPYQWSFATESFPWLHFYEIQGLFLDQNNIQVILGDNNGDIWVALSSTNSSDDLFRFNGFDPTDFHKILEPLGRINAIAQDSIGNIWVASESDISGLGGVHVYDGMDWTHYNSGNSGLSDDSIKCITVDSQDNIWVGSSFSGIFRFDGTSWTNYNIDNSNLSNNWVIAIQADENDHIWLGTAFGGIESLDDSNIPETWNNHSSEIETQLGISLPFTNILVSGSGKIWAGTNFGLLSYDIVTNQWELITQIGDYPLDGQLTSLAWDSLNNILYVGTYDGVIILDGMNWDTLLLGDISPEILEIAIDVFGNKWIGTNNSLSRYDTDPPSLLSNTPSNNKKNVSRTSKIVLNFSEPMNRSSVLSAFSISPSVSFSSSWDIHNTKLTLTPKSNLKSNKKYSATLSKAATDIQGYRLADSASWSFTTVRSSTTTSTSFPSTIGGFSFPGSASLFGNLSTLNLSGMLSSQLRTSLSFGGFGQSSMLKLPTSNLFGSGFGSTFSALSTLKLNIPSMTNFSNLTNFSSMTNLFGGFGTGGFSSITVPGKIGSIQSLYPALRNLQFQTSLPNLNLP